MGCLSLNISRTSKKIGPLGATPPLYSLIFYLSLFMSLSITSLVCLFLFLRLRIALKCQVKERILLYGLSISVKHVSVFTDFQQTLSLTCCSCCLFFFTEKLVAQNNKTFFLASLSQNLYFPMRSLCSFFSPINERPVNLFLQIDF